MGLGGALGELVGSANMEVMGGGTDAGDRCGGTAPRLPGDITVIEIAARPVTAAVDAVAPTNHDKVDHFGRWMKAGIARKDSCHGGAWAATGMGMTSGAV
ncbi:MAG TPA: hypothetical protein VNF75_01570 [Candidatus Dormibacteraeota bacterium]|nr:hypothetical protein [Candidatus Dormibacteraeota bacterium]